MMSYDKTLDSYIGWWHDHRIEVSSSAMQTAWRDYLEHNTMTFGAVMDLLDDPQFWAWTRRAGVVVSPDMQVQA